jgi:hypothetical protein
LQACKAAAAAVELAAADPWSYHTTSSSSSSYCYWLPQHAGSLLQAYLQLGYKPPGIVLHSILTALMLHWEFKQSHQNGEAEQSVQAADQQQQQQQLEGQLAAVQLLDVLAQLGFHPGHRVSNRSHKS